MKKQCPECKKMMSGNECGCGFKLRGSSNARQSGATCCFRTRGKKCLMPGSVSYNIPTDTNNYPDFYCGWHFSNDQPLDKEKFTNWLLEREPRLLESNYHWLDYYWNKVLGEEQPIPEKYAFDYLEPVKFNLKDKYQVKGLFILRDSIPKLFEKIIFKNPEMKAAMDELKEIPNTKIYKSF